MKFVSCQMRLQQMQRFGIVLAGILPKLQPLSRSLHLSIFSVCEIAPALTCQFAPLTQAQIIPDSSLSTTVTSPDNQNFVIENGNRAGNNLFHSFSEFSVPTNGSAVFDNAIEIQNIFSRVTGINPSDIDGVIQANGTANLFLLNPNGLLFGKNASLDIGGSFLATTAESILFSDNIEFSAVATAPAPLLTISTPIGLRIDNNPSSITVKGTGHNLTLGWGAIPIRDQRPVGLQVDTGQTLALIGGDIQIEGGNLTANQGRVELGSVAQSGTVFLPPTADGFTVDYAAIDRFGDLRFTQAASVDVSGEGSGNLHFQGGTISVLEGSTIISNVLGADPGGEVRVRAAESVDIIGTQNRDLPSAFVNQGELGSTGHVGNVSIETGRLQIADGGFIANSSPSGAGPGGDLTITANEIDIIGDTRLFDDFEDYFENVYSTGLLMEVLSSVPEQGGDFGVNAQNLHSLEAKVGTIHLNVDTLRLVGEALISTKTFGLEQGGSITIYARGIDLIGGALYDSGIYSSSNGSGSSGAITLDVDTLRATGAARVSSIAFSQGNGGPITIDANEIELMGTNSMDFISGIFVSAFSEGDAGSVDLDVNTLRILEGGQIAGGTFDQGTGSSITISANEIELTGISPSGEFTSGIFVSTLSDAAGNAGTIDIQAENRIQITAGAQITASTSGAGNAGDIRLQAGEIDVSGVSNIGEYHSRIAAFSETDFDAGTIDITAEQLQVTDQGRISVSSLGQGDASELTIRADQIWLTDGGALQAESAAGSQGNIVLNADSLLFLQRGGLISTNATNGATGGNITIEAPVILGLGNSDIVANAVQGDGGNIDITTQALLGLQFRDFLTPDNDITASSQAGVNGIVQIKTPDLDPNQGTVELPSNLTDPSNQISTGCLMAANNSFVVSGRGSLPDGPSSLDSTTMWEDLRPLETEAAVRVSTVPAPSLNIPLTEATGMMMDTHGQVTLVASTTPSSNAQNRVSCGSRTNM
ncbi:S-layer family protein [Leptolyngbya cf. ectocarpi LEGE 11479]|uniref:S-layer family protein n=1 Tax=Leptolyngbya cf. ectocarpi LEGE 11479 TaxID=1828722 RepID=A0A929F9U2_LEPEC|nr:S-layer family protein [Leptolyngbya ectocarpi]MBE9067583.1 S-layer family protein [Leptolyngbya cf. ectocarpi LEGE 11479]